MLSKNEIIDKAYEFGFDDVGMTTADPFPSQKEALLERQDSYAHLMYNNHLIVATDPRKVMPEAKSIVVLVDLYLKESFNPYMETHFGRLYIDEDRIFQEERVKSGREFVAFLRENGIKAKNSGELPHRATAARAGVGNVGKNCLMYSNKPGHENSWMIISTILLDRNTNRIHPLLKTNMNAPTGAGAPVLWPAPPGP